MNRLERPADLSLAWPSAIRVGARRLILLCAVFFAVSVAPAAADNGFSYQDCRPSATEWLAAHQSGNGVVFPREGIAAQSAIETRKRDRKPPADSSADDASPATPWMAAATALSTAPAVLHAAASTTGLAHSWYSRAPPKTS